MRLSRKWIVGAAVPICASVVFLSGCMEKSATEIAKKEAPVTEAVSRGESSKTQTPPTDEHEHKPGAHGGTIVPIGADSYHAEAVVEKSGALRLLILGKDESRIQEVELQPVTAYVRAEGDTDATPIELQAKPQDGDAEGKTSQFVGQLPESVIGKAIDVTIPNLRIAGERFRVGFTTASASHDTGMPQGAQGDEERQLYLTPGGKYTQADIVANGNMTASKKFKGIKSNHDAKPQAGDKICPISMTKANANFTWIIDGKAYEFCCPPCVDEYVRMAKEEPEKLQDPSEFVKK